jgi:hypothetical protein
MPPLSAQQLLMGMKNTLAAIGIDYERQSKEVGPVGEAEARASGQVFTTRDHVCGLVLAQLSNQRPWKPIAENEERLREIFHDYDPDALQQADPVQLEAKVRAIRCGNRAIRKQMQALQMNIAILRRIESDWGSLDRFVESGSPDQVALLLSEPGSYKLKQVGYTLALEYLRNVGIRSAKPDLHVRRILGPQRLAHFDHRPEEGEAAQRVADLAAESGVSATYLDIILWLFCSPDYGGVCSATPRCSICHLRDNCSYPTKPGS